MDPELERRNNDHLRPFWKILDFVIENNSHLLTQQNQNIVAKFLELSEYAKFLFVRLFDRNYTESKELRARKIEGYVGGAEIFKLVLTELVRNGLMLKVQEEDLPKVLTSLTGDELKSIIKLMKLSAQSNKKLDLVKALLRAVKEGGSQTGFGGITMAKVLTQHIQNCHGGTHVLTNEALETFLRIYQIYYYDSGYDDSNACFSRLYLQGIGQRRYFNYAVDKNMCLFASIQDFDEYQEAVVEDVYWGDENRPARIGTPVLGRLDAVIEKVISVVENIDSNGRGRFSGEYIWMRVAVRIGSQSASALGQGDRTRIMYRQWKLLEQFLQQNVYAGHKRFVALTSKIHVENELYKTTNSWDWIERAHEDVKICLDCDQSKTGSTHDFLDPLIIDMDKKIKAFQTQFNKRHKEWLKRNKSKKSGWSTGDNSPDAMPEKVTYKSMMPALTNADEVVIVGKVKPLEEPPKEPEIKRQKTKQSLIKEYFGPNGTGVPPKKQKKEIETIVIESDSEEEGEIEVVNMNCTNNTTDSLAIETPVGVSGPVVWASESDDRTIRVEQVTLEQYATTGWRGWHDEGRILRMIFTLLFWDIIFMDCPGVFYNQCQTAPLDMYSPDFYMRRKPQIEERLDELKASINVVEMQLRNIYAAVSFSKWDRGQKTMRSSGPWVVGANFDRFDIEDLVTVVSYLGLDAVIRICQIFAQDYYKYDSGLPDLLLVNDELRKCKLVEVKSKNDSLSDTQRVWIHHMINIGVLVEISRVLTPEQYQQHIEKINRSNSRSKKGTKAKP